MQYITTEQSFKNNYPVEFAELSQEQEHQARAEFDQVTAIESEVKKTLINEGKSKSQEVGFYAK